MISTGFLMLIVTVLILSSNQVSFESRYSNGSLGDVDSFNRSYIAVTKFVIDGNWSVVAANYSWCTGSGTVGDPYIISGIEVDGLFSGSCLTIKNTNDHFIIENSKFFNGGSDFGNAGVRLENVKNGTIRSTNITGVTDGVYIDTNSASITVTNNNWTIRGTLMYGVWSNYATDLTISYNEMHSNGVGREGIHLQGTTYSLVSHNTLNGADIGLVYNADHNIIEDNVIIWGRITTSSSGGVVNNTIRRNIIRDCSRITENYAIWLTGGSTKNLITENTISNVSFYYGGGGVQGEEYRGTAILVEGSSPLNNITNNVINNSENGIGVSNSINNTITGNTILVYQNCIYGNSVNYSTESDNTCSIIQRSSDENGTTPSISLGHFFLVFIPVGIIIVFLSKFKKWIKME
jgi:parallel beta-helix repeat protein